MKNMIGVIVLLATACGSKGDRGEGGHAIGEGSGTTRLPKEDLVTVPAGTYIAKALHMPSDGSCSPEIAGNPERGKNGELGMDYWTDQPQRVERFAIDKRLVNCEDFRLCVDQGGCAAKRSEWSCTDGDTGDAEVRLQQAEAYCAWRKRRLPSYLQWQAAVRGPTGISAPDCRAGSGDAGRCVFTSQFGVLVSDVVGDELTRSSECWPTVGSEPVGIAPVEIPLAWDTWKSLVALAPLRRIEKHSGGFRCVEDK